MKILRAIGLGVAIITLKFLVGDVFRGFENTAIALFETLETGLEITEDNLRSLSEDQTSL